MTSAPSKNGSDIAIHRQQDDVADQVIQAKLQLRIAFILRQGGEMIFHLSLRGKAVLQPVLFRSHCMIAGRFADP